MEVTQLKQNMGELDGNGGQERAGGPPCGEKARVGGGASTLGPSPLPHSDFGKSPFLFGPQFHCVFSKANGAAEFWSITSSGTLTGREQTARAS